MSDKATGSLGPIRTGEESAMVDLIYTQDENTSELLQRQQVSKTVTHEVQAKEDFMSSQCKSRDLGKNTWIWENFTHKREPHRISTNISQFRPKAQKIQRWGATAQKYGDEAWVTRYPVRKSMISIPKTIATAMKKGFIRLQIRQVFAAMLNPVRWEIQSDINRNKTDTMVVALPNSRTGALVAVFKRSANAAITGAERDRIRNAGGICRVGSGATPDLASTFTINGTAIGSHGAEVWYMKPTLNTFTKIKRLFTNFNVSAGMTPCMTVTPNFQEQLEDIKQYQDRFNVFVGAADYSRIASFKWKDIKFVRAEPEVVPGPYMAGKIIDCSRVKNLHDIPAVSATPLTIAPEIVPLSDDATKGVQITQNGNELLPIWFPENTYKITDKGQDIALKVTKIPLYKEEKILWEEMWLGGAREQNVLQFVLVVGYEE